MKQVICYLTLVLLSTGLASAQKNIFFKTQVLAPVHLAATNTSYSFTKKSYLVVDNIPDKRDADFYLHRSRNQRIVGWTTLGAGLVLSGIGLIVINGDVTTNSGNDDAAAVLFLAGAASGITSIPFMIMASANKHKARVMLKDQHTGFGAPPVFNKNIPGISMNISLGK